jgi:hypothetical protein
VLINSLGTTPGCDDKITHKGTVSIIKNKFKVKIYISIFIDKYKNEPDRKKGEKKGRKYAGIST